MTRAPNGSVWAKRKRQVRKQVIAKHGLTCWLCKKPIATEADVTLDHVLPVKKGGRLHLANLRPAHKRCNGSRGHGPPPWLFAESETKK